MQGNRTDTEQARDQGVASGQAVSGSLEHCPYDEFKDPILRAIWQDAFVTARLYGFP